ncbi:MAG: 30S ribosomal protein S16 [Firmicutes bacterium]|nr:30S ribosomal protein S16 [Dethiobacter sp.]MBS3888605.1 30S ribosomal protein S16 [Bacillota bacterium]
MATKIRLKRMGAKKAPFYRLVVADSRAPRDGRFVEEIGYYNPTQNPPAVKVDHERATYWLGQGVQMSDTVRSIFNKAGLLEKS